MNESDWDCRTWQVGDKMYVFLEGGLFHMLRDVLSDVAIG